MNFSLQDKIRITLKLDEFGINFIEGGWPGSNRKDEEYFKAVRDFSLKNSKVVAFGSPNAEQLMRRRIEH